MATRLRRSLGGSSGKRTPQLKLSLDQANEDLRQSLDNRRAVDTKIFGLTSLAAALVGILVTVRPWASKSADSIILFVAAFAAYALTIVIGLTEYFPTESSTSNARAILEEKTQPYDVLVQWVTESLLDFADENYRIAHRKSRTLMRMLIIFLVAAVLLALGTFVQ